MNNFLYVKLTVNIVHDIHFNLTFEKIIRGHSYLLDNLPNHQQWSDTIENFIVSNDKILLSYIGSLVHKFNA